MTGFASAVVTALAVAVTTLAPATMPAAAADTPASCESYKKSAMTCKVWSESMDRHIPVVVKPAKTPGNDKVIQFLDGIDGGDGWSSRAINYVDGDDATVVFPAAEPRSFFVDWDAPAPGGKEMKYETFMTRELPAYLEKEFGVPNGGRERTGIVGLSMGAYSAMNLASRNPDMYRSVLALSGFYNNQSLVGRISIDGTAMTHGDDNNGMPWQSETSRAANNPWANVDKLDMPVHMAVSTGIPDPCTNYPLRTSFDGALIETGSLGATIAWDLWTKLHLKNNVYVTYVPVGIHAYDTWVNAAFRDQKLYWKFNRF
ncbi:MAG TPA: esterase family protein [Candidatus Corynebacterium avicola]|uniref:Esterase family protein n=1 Tax=Candidatus Corynebacterium avicola TaxID=2838527 RepID=A0A9D1ULE5_9CORY|nr:esterase family protein [Candidatus Corynebacterium avicola]